MGIGVAVYSLLTNIVPGTAAKGMIVGIFGIFGALGIAAMRQTTESPVDMPDPAGQISALIEELNGLIDGLENTTEIEKEHLSAAIEKAERFNRRVISSRGMIQSRKEQVERKIGEPGQELLGESYKKQLKDLQNILEISSAAIEKAEKQISYAKGRMADVDADVTPAETEAPRLYRYKVWLYSVMAAVAVTLAAIGVKGWFDRLESARIPVSPVTPVLSIDVEERAEAPSVETKVAEESEAPTEGEPEVRPEAPAESEGEPEVGPEAPAEPEGEPEVSAESDAPTVVETEVTEESAVPMVGETEITPEAPAVTPLEPEVEPAEPSVEPAVSPEAQVTPVTPDVPEVAPVVPEVEPVVIFGPPAPSAVEMARREAEKQETPELAARIDGLVRDVTARFRRRSTRVNAVNELGALHTPEAVTALVEIILREDVGFAGRSARYLQNPVNTELLTDENISDLLEYMKNGNNLGAKLLLFDVLNTMADREDVAAVLRPNDPLTSLVWKLGASPMGQATHEDNCKWAAYELARLKDPRAIDELRKAARYWGYDPVAVRAFNDAIRYIRNAQAGREQSISINDLGRIQIADIPDTRTREEASAVRRAEAARETEPEEAQKDAVEVTDGSFIDHANIVERAGELYRSKDYTGAVIALIPAIAESSARVNVLAGRLVPEQQKLEDIEKEYKASRRGMIITWSRLEPAQRDALARRLSDQRARVELIEKRISEIEESSMIQRSLRLARNAIVKMRGEGGVVQQAQYTIALLYSMLGDRENAEKVSSQIAPQIMLSGEGRELRDRIERGEAGILDNIADLLGTSNLIAGHRLYKFRDIAPDLLIQITRDVSWLGRYRLYASLGWDTSLAPDSKGAFTAAVDVGATLGGGQKQQVEESARRAGIVLAQYYGNFLKAAIDVKVAWDRGVFASNAIDLIEQQKEDQMSVWRDAQISIDRQAALSAISRLDDQINKIRNEELLPAEREVRQLLDIPAGADIDFTNPLDLRDIFENAGRYGADLNLPPQLAMNKAVEEWARSVYRGRQRSSTILGRIRNTTLDIGVASTLRAEKFGDLLKDVFSIKKGFGSFMFYARIDWPDGLEKDIIHARYELEEKALWREQAEKDAITGRHTLELERAELENFIAQFDLYIRQLEAKKGDYESPENTGMWNSSDFSNMMMALNEARRIREKDRNDLERIESELLTYRQIPVMGDARLSLDGAKGLVDAVVERDMGLRALRSELSLARATEDYMRKPSNRFPVSIGRLGIGASHSPQHMDAENWGNILNLGFDTDLRISLADLMGYPVDYFEKHGEILELREQMRRHELTNDAMQIARNYMSLKEGLENARARMELTRRKQEIARRDARPAWERPRDVDMEMAKETANVREVSLEFTRARNQLVRFIGEDFVDSLERGDVDVRALENMLTDSGFDPVAAGKKMAGLTEEKARIFRKIISTGRFDIKVAYTFINYEEESVKRENFIDERTGKPVINPETGKYLTDEVSDGSTERTPHSYTRTSIDFPDILRRITRRLQERKDARQQEEIVNLMNEMNEERTERSILMAKAAYAHAVADHSEAVKREGNLDRTYELLNAQREANNFYLMDPSILIDWEKTVLGARDEVRSRKAAMEQARADFIRIAGTGRLAELGSISDTEPAADMAEVEDRYRSALLELSRTRAKTRGAINALLNTVRLNFSMWQDNPDQLDHYIERIDGYLSEQRAYRNLVLANRGRLYSGFSTSDRALEESAYWIEQARLGRDPDAVTQQQQNADAIKGTISDIRKRMGENKDDLEKIDRDIKALEESKAELQKMKDARLIPGWDHMFRVDLSLDIFGTWQHFLTGRQTGKVEELKEIERLIEIANNDFELKGIETEIASYQNLISGQEEALLKLEKAMLEYGRDRASVLDRIKAAEQALNESRRGKLALEERHRSLRSKGLAGLQYFMENGRIKVERDGKEVDVRDLDLKAIGSEHFQAHFYQNFSEALFNGLNEKWPGVLKDVLGERIARAGERREGPFYQLLANATAWYQWGNLEPDGKAGINIGINFSRTRQFERMAVRLNALAKSVGADSARHSFGVKMGMLPREIRNNVVSMNNASRTLVGETALLERMSEMMGEGNADVLQVLRHMQNAHEASMLYSAAETAYRQNVATFLVMYAAMGGDVDEFMGQMEEAAEESRAEDVREAERYLKEAREKLNRGDLAQAMALAQKARALHGDGEDNEQINSLLADIDETVGERAMVSAASREIDHLERNWDVRPAVFESDNPRLREAVRGFLSDLIPGEDINQEDIEYMAEIMVYQAHSNRLGYDLDRVVAMLERAAERVRREDVQDWIARIARTKAEAMVRSGRHTQEEIDRYLMDKRWVLALVIPDNFGRAIDGYETEGKPRYSSAVGFFTFFEILADNRFSNKGYTETLERSREFADDLMERVLKAIEREDALFLAEVETDIDADGLGKASRLWDEGAVWVKPIMDHLYGRSFSTNPAHKGDRNILFIPWSHAVLSPYLADLSLSEIKTFLQTWLPDLLRESKYFTETEPGTLTSPMIESLISERKRVEADKEMHDTERTVRLNSLDEDIRSQQSLLREKTVMNNAVEMLKFIERAVADQKDPQEELDRIVYTSRTIRDLMASGRVVGEVDSIRTFLGTYKDLRESIVPGKEISDIYIISRGEDMARTIWTGRSNNSEDPEQGEFRGYVKADITERYPNGTMKRITAYTPPVAEEDLVDMSQVSSLAARDVFTRFNELCHADRGSYEQWIGMEGELLGLVSQDLSPRERILRASALALARGIIEYIDNNSSEIIFHLGADGSPTEDVARKISPSGKVFHYAERRPDVRPLVDKPGFKVFQLTRDNEGYFCDYSAEDPSRVFRKRLTEKPIGEYGKDELSEMPHLVGKAVEIGFDTDLDFVPYDGEGYRQGLPVYMKILMANGEINTLNYSYFFPDGIGARPALKFERSEDSDHYYLYKLAYNDDGRTIDEANSHSIGIRADVSIEGNVATDIGREVAVHRYCPTGRYHFTHFTDRPETIHVAYRDRPHLSVAEVPRSLIGFYDDSPEVDSKDLHELTTEDLRVKYRQGENVDTFLKNRATWRRGYDNLERPTRVYVQKIGEKHGFVSFIDPDKHVASLAYQKRSDIRINPNFSGEMLSIPPEEGHLAHYRYDAREKPTMAVVVDQIAGKTFVNPLDPRTGEHRGYVEGLTPDVETMPLGPDDMLFGRADGVPQKMVIMQDGGAYFWSAALEGKDEVETENEITTALFFLEDDKGNVAVESRQISFDTKTLKVGFSDEAENAQFIFDSRQKRSHYGYNVFEEKMWTMFFAIDTIYSSQRLLEVERMMLDMLEKTIMADMRADLPQSSTMRTQASLPNSAEDTLWAKVDIYVKSYRGKDKAKMEEGEASTARRQALTNAIWYRILSRIGYEEGLLRGEVKQHLERMRNVANGVLAKYEADGLDEEYRVFVREALGSRLEDQTDFLDNFTIPGDETTKKLEAGTIAPGQISGDGTLDMGSSELVLMVRSRTQGERKLTVICEDIAGRKSRRSVSVWGNRRAGTLENPDVEAALWYRVSFTPSAEDPFYWKDELFDPSRVKSFSFSSDDSVLDFKRVRVEAQAPVIERTPGEERETITMVIRDPLGDAIGDIGILPRDTWPEAKGMAGVLQYTIPGAEGRPSDFTGRTCDIQWTLPQAYSHAGVNGMFVLRDIHGMPLSRSFVADSDGNVRVNMDIPDAREAGFDPANIVGMEVIFELTPVRPSHWWGVGLLLISLVAVGRSLASIVSWIRKKTEKKGSPLSDVQQPPSVRRTRITDLGGIINRGIKNIEKWDEDLGFMFIERGAKEEDKSMALPRLREKEIWDFFDPARYPRFNLSQAKNALFFAAIAAFAVTRAAWAPTVFMMPYLFISVMVLLPNYNFLNVRKWSWWGFYMLAAVLTNTALLSFFPGASAAAILTAALIGVSLLLPFLRYFTKIRPSSVKKYMENQRKVLEEVRAKMMLVRGDQVFTNDINAVPIAPGMSLDAYVESIKASGLAKYVLPQVDLTLQRTPQDVKQAMLDIVDEHSQAMQQIGGLQRYRRTSDPRPGEVSISRPYEARQREKIVRTVPFSTLLNDAIDQIGDLQKRTGLLGERPDPSKVKSSGVFGRVAGPVVAAIAITGAAALLGWQLVSIMALSHVFLAPIVLAVAYGSLLGAARYVRSSLEQTYMLFDPSIDMRDIFRRKERDVFTYSGGPLFALDVWRFLTQTREAARLAAGSAAGVTSRNLQQMLESKLMGHLANRERVLRGGPFDSRSINRIKKVFSLTRARLMMWRVILGTGAYWVGVISLWGISQIFNLVNKGRLLGWSEMYKYDYAFLNILGNVKNLIFGDATLANTFHSVIGSLPMGALQLVSFVVIGSLVLYALKYHYYAIGEKAKRYITDRNVTWRDFAAKGIKILLSGFVLFVIPIWYQPLVMIPAIGVAAGTIISIIAGAVFFGSIYGVIVSILAARGYSGINVEHMLYEGSDATYQETADRQFESCHLDKKLTMDELVMINDVNAAVGRYQTGAGRRITADELERVLDAEVGMRNRMQWQKMFGRGAVPSGTDYGINSNMTTAQAIEQVQISYSQLNDISDLVGRMSGRGFVDMLRHYHNEGVLSAEQAATPIWTALDDPSSIGLTAQQVRDFIDTTPNERRIVQMFDFLPKVENWVVVVMGDEEQVIGLVESLSNFRYPFRKLKIVVAAEEWDNPTSIMVEGLQRDNRVPGSEFCEISPAPAREKGHPYTKPGANTFALKPDTTDGAFGLIFDAEDIPDNLMVLKMISGVADGIGEARRLGRGKFSDQLNRALEGISVPRGGSGAKQRADRYREAVKRASKKYTRSLSAADWEVVRRLGFKRGDHLARHMNTFINNLTTLLELVDENRAFLSPALIWQERVKARQGISARVDRETERYRELCMTLMNIPGYGEMATDLALGRMNEDEFIRRLIVGEFERINMPKNGQGRLSQDRNAVSYFPWISGAFFRNEYGSWYSPGWSGMHSAQDTFKPLGGTTGWFCTEPAEELIWEELAGVFDHDQLNTMREEYNLNSKLLSVGGWDENQVAEDYELGLVLWFHGFNVVSFDALTVEDPGAATSLTFETRVLQTSRWNKGYVEGDIQITGQGKMLELMRRKGFWGAINFITTTWSSSMMPLLFRMARAVTITWWVVYATRWFLQASVFMLGRAFGGTAAWLFGNTALLEVATTLHETIGEAMAVAINFSPVGWGWAVGPAISVGMIIIYVVFSVKSAFKGFNDSLGYDQMIEGLEEYRGKTERRIGVAHMFDAYLEYKNEPTPDNLRSFQYALDAVEQIVFNTRRKNDILNFVRERNFEHVESSFFKNAGRDAEFGANNEYILEMSQQARGRQIDAMHLAVEELNESIETLGRGSIFNHRGSIFSFSLLGGRGLSLLFPLTWWSLAGLFVGSLVAILVPPLFFTSVAGSFLGALANFTVITLGVAAIFTLAWVLWSLLYIGVGRRDHTEGIRGMRVRLASAAIFMPFYHMFYLMGNKVAWSEIGPRTGYWWLTPRAAQMEVELKKKYIRALEKRDTGPIRRVRTALQEGAKTLFLKPDAKVEKDLKETKSKWQALIQYGFLAGIFYFVVFGTRMDFREFVFGVIHAIRAGSPGIIAETAATTGGMVPFWGIFALGAFMVFEIGLALIRSVRLERAGPEMARVQAPETQNMPAVQYQPGQIVQPKVRWWRTLAIAVLAVALAVVAGRHSPTSVEQETKKTAEVVEVSKDVGKTVAEEDAQSVPVGEFIRDIGLSVPWVNYELGIGDAEKGFASEFGKKALAERFSALNQAGISRARIFLFCKDMKGISNTGVGKFVFDDAVWDNMDELIRMAEKHGIKLTPVLLNHDVIYYPGTGSVARNAHWFMRGINRDGLAELFGGFIKRYADREAIEAVEIMNEPRVVNDAKSHGADVVEFRDVQDFIIRLASTVQERGKKVVISCIGEDDLILNWIPLLHGEKADGMNADNTVIHLHVYGDDPVRMVSSASELHNRMTKNFPIGIGEVGIKEEDGSLRQPTREEIEAMLQFYRTKGMRYVFFWQDGPESMGDFDLEILRDVKTYELEREAKDVRDITEQPVRTSMMKQGMDGAMNMMVPFMLLGLISTAKAKRAARSTRDEQEFKKIAVQYITRAIEDEGYVTYMLKGGIATTPLSRSEREGRDLVGEHYDIVYYPSEDSPRSPLPREVMALWGHTGLKFGIDQLMSEGWRREELERPSGSVEAENLGELLKWIEEQKTDSVRGNNKKLLELENSIKYLSSPIRRVIASRRSGAMHTRGAIYDTLVARSSGEQLTYLDGFSDQIDTMSEQEFFKRIVVGYMNAQKAHDGSLRKLFYDRVISLNEEQKDAPQIYNAVHSPADDELVRDFREAPLAELEAIISAMEQHSGAQAERAPPSEGEAFEVEARTQLGLIIENIMSQEKMAGLDSSQQKDAREFLNGFAGSMPLEHRQIAGSQEKRVTEQLEKAYDMYKEGQATFRVLTPELTLKDPETGEQVTVEDPETGEKKDVGHTEILFAAPETEAHMASLTAMVEEMGGKVTSIWNFAHSGIELINLEVTNASGEALSKEEEDALIRNIAQVSTHLIKIKGAPSDIKKVVFGVAEKHKLSVGEVMDLKSSDYRGLLRGPFDKEDFDAAIEYIMSEIDREVDSFLRAGNEPKAQSVESYKMFLQPLLEKVRKGDEKPIYYAIVEMEEAKQTYETLDSIQNKEVVGEMVVIYGTLVKHLRRETRIEEGQEADALRQLNDICDVFEKEIAAGETSYNADFVQDVREKAKDKIEKDKFTALAAIHRVIMEKVREINEQEKSLAEKNALKFGTWFYLTRAEEIVDGIEPDRRTGNVVLLVNFMSPQEVRRINRFFPDIKELVLVSPYGSSTVHWAVAAKQTGNTVITGAKVINEDHFIPAEEVIPEGSMVIVDAAAGDIMSQANESVMRKYQEEKNRVDELNSYYKTRLGLAAVSRGGTELLIRSDEADLRGIDKGDFVSTDGAWFRTEWLYDGANKPISEDLEKIFLKSSEAIGGDKTRPLTLRLADTAKDKRPATINESELRGTEWGLSDDVEGKQIYHDQLKAMMMAYAKSKERNIRALFPMVEVSHVHKIKEMREKIRAEILAEDPTLKEEDLADFQVGSMIENPNAVNYRDEIIKQSDFVSVGLNDLTSETLAADRESEKSEEMFGQLNPTVMMSVIEVVESAAKLGKQVEFCGEMAHKPKFVFLAVGLKALYGNVHVSSAYPYIPRLKELVRNIDDKKSKEYIEKIKKGFAELDAAKFDAEVVKIVEGIEKGIPKTEPYMSWKKDILVGREPEQLIHQAMPLAETGIAQPFWASDRKAETALEKPPVSAVIGIVGLDQQTIDNALSEARLAGVVSVLALDAGLPAKERLEKLQAAGREHNTLWCGEINIEQGAESVVKAEGLVVGSVQGQERLAELRQSMLIEQVLTMLEAIEGSKTAEFMEKYRADIAELKKFDVRTATEEEIEKVKGAWRSILSSVNLPSMVPVIRDQSIYNLKITARARNDMSAPLTARTMTYLQNETRPESLVHVTVSSLAEVKTMAEAYRMRDPKKLRLKITLALAGEDISAKELEDMRDNKIALLKNMEIDRLISPEDLEIMTRAEADSVWHDNRLVDIAAYGEDNIISSDLTVDRDKKRDVPKGVIFMEYNHIATGDVFDMNLTVLAHKGDVAALNAIGLTSLSLVNGIILYMQPIEAENLENILKEFERYREVMIRA